jgi:hypothetical protein
MSYLGRKLADREPEHVRKAFLEALTELTLTPKARVAQARRGPRRVVRGAAAGARRTRKAVVSVVSKGKREERRFEKQERTFKHHATAHVAEELTSGWIEASPAIGSGSGEASNWRVALRAYIRTSAVSGLKGEHEARWRYVVTATIDGDLPRAKAIDQWSGRLTDLVIQRWLQNEELRPLVADLNYQSGYQLDHALVVASQEISHTLRRMATRLVPLTVVSGGGVLLVVLFLDKG